MFRYRYWRYVNLKIPIYRLSVNYCVIPIAGFKRYFKSNTALSIITFGNKKTKFIITEGRFCYFAACSVVIIDAHSVVIIAAYRVFNRQHSVGTCHINICENLFLSSFSSSICLPKNTSKTDDIPVFNGILITMYRYSVFGIPNLPKSRYQKGVIF